MTPKLLIAGHIGKDVTADEWRAGGGVLYAAAQASRLGVEVAALTACAAEVEPVVLLPDVEWRVLPSESTTTFENQYEDGHRSQRLLACGRQLRFDGLPEGWIEAPVKLLTPLFHEIEPSKVADLARDTALLGVAAQGWLRELDGDRVKPAPFEASPPWLAGNVVFVSDEDVQDAEAVAVWRERVRVVALTRGRGGCTVWDTKGRHDVSAAPVRETDPTGAGDVFAAAFLVRYSETEDALEAARFGAAAGALSVRGEGLASVASRGEVEALLARGQVRVA